MSSDRSSRDDFSDMESDVDVVSVGDYKDSAFVSSPKSDAVNPRTRHEEPNGCKLIRCAAVSASFSSDSKLGSPLAGSTGSSCNSPPVGRHPCFPMIPPMFPPHPALRLPTMLPFMASRRQQEDAMLAMALRHRVIQSTLGPLSPPPNPFMLPLIAAGLQPQPPMPLNITPQVMKDMTTVFPPTDSRVIRSPSMAPPPPLPAKPHQDKLETVNGGFGVKNPLARNPALQDHLLNTMVEKAEDSFVCKVCKKKFPLQRLLNRHIKCHSAIKRYLCTFCGKGFNDTFDLKRHTRTHTGVRPYKCDQCNKAFTQRCSLESHCKKVHNQQFTYQFKQRRSKLYVCEQCGTVTDDPEKHFLHLKELHPGSPALQKCYDKRQFKFSKEQLPRILQHQSN